MIERNKLYNKDAMIVIVDFPDTSVNIYYTDTPYNLGSEYFIDSEGHYNFTKASDFMGEWKAMDGRWWNGYFREINRTLKHGGYFITHNIDRQSDMWSYYARRNGLIPMQKLYWMFVDHFPKGVDVTKQLDRLQGQDRIKVGEKKGAQTKSTGKYGAWGQTGEDGYYAVTIPTSKIARKYEGYVYGIAPLKQMVEEILVFFKPSKDTVPKDILQMEQAKAYMREEIMLAHPSVLNLKKTSIPTPDGLKWTPQLLVAEEMMPHLLENPNINHIEAAKLKESVKVIHEVSTFEETDSNKSPFFLEPKVKGNKKHVSPKPLPLVRWVIDLFKPPDNILIVDTFMGTGAIPYVCKEQGIDYVGIELDEAVFKDAKEYIDGTNNSLTLFG